MPRRSPVARVRVHTTLFGAQDDDDLPLATARGRRRLEPLPKSVGIPAAGAQAQRAIQHARGVLQPRRLATQVAARQSDRTHSPG